MALDARRRGNEETVMILWENIVAWFWKRVVAGPSADIDELEHAQIYWADARASERLAAQPRPDVILAIDKYPEGKKASLERLYARRDRARRKIRKLQILQMI